MEEKKNLSPRKKPSEEVLELLPHRPPFLFVDEVIEYNAAGKHIKARKTISGDEDFFRGHYPGEPIMPGVLLCEAAFQTGALLAVRLARESKEAEQRKTPLLVKIQNARFRSVVKPGTTLEISVEVLERVSSAWYLVGNITAAGEKILRVEFSFTLANG